MPPTQKPVQVDPNMNFIDYEGTKIQLPKPLEQMTSDDWVRISTSPRSPLHAVKIDNTSFSGLDVALDNKNYIPQWLYAGHRAGTADAFDPMERSIQMGSVLCTIDDLDETSKRRFAGSVSADGHIRRNDVILAKIAIIKYWKIKASDIQKSNDAIEYQSVEGKAFENIDGPHYIKGNKEQPLFQATEHQVKYQDRLSI